MLLKNDFNPKAILKLMGHSKGIITKDVYGDNKGIIADRIPEMKVFTDIQTDVANDQPEAIKGLADGFREGNQFQTLLGVTGFGRTLTIANIIQALQKPTLVIAHNKTLVAQLYVEFKEFFPENAVEYFVSYYEIAIF